MASRLRRHHARGRRVQHRQHHLHRQRRGRSGDRQADLHRRLALRRGHRPRHHQPRRRHHHRLQGLGLARQHRRRLAAPADRRRRGGHHRRHRHAQDGLLRLRRTGHRPASQRHPPARLWRLRLSLEHRRHHRAARTNWSSGTRLATPTTTSTWLPSAVPTTTAAWRGSGKPITALTGRQVPSDREGYEFQINFIPSIISAKRSFIGTIPSLQCPPHPLPSLETRR